MVDKFSTYEILFCPFLQGDKKYQTIDQRLGKRFKYKFLEVINILIYLPNELSKSTVRPSGALFTVFEAVLVSTAGCGATGWTGL